jgi:hypothetical protein
MKKEDHMTEHQAWHEGGRFESDIDGSLRRRAAESVRQDFVQQRDESDSEYHQRLDDELES